MNKNILFDLGGQKYLFPITKELDKKLKNSLKDDYLFDNNNNLILKKDSDKDTYNLKQKTFQVLVDEIKEYDLPANILNQVISLEQGINNNKNEIESTDLVHLENMIGEASNILSQAIKTLPTKEEKKKEQLKELSGIESKPSIDSKKASLNKESIEETNDKNEENILTKDNNIENLETKDSNSTYVDKSLTKLENDLDIYGINKNNINYFSDQTIKELEKISQENNINMDAMFSDYLNGYLSSRKNNQGKSKTREMLESVVIKKAINQGLIPDYFNQYLNNEYKDLNIDSNNYVNISKELITNIANTNSTNISKSNNRTTFEEKTLTDNAFMPNNPQNNSSDNQKDNISSNQINANNINQKPKMSNINTPNNNFPNQGVNLPNNENNERIEEISNNNNSNPNETIEEEKEETNVSPSPNIPNNIIGKRVNNKFNIKGKPNIAMPNIALTKTEVNDTIHKKNNNINSFLINEEEEEEENENINSEETTLGASPKETNSEASNNKTENHQPPNSSLSNLSNNLAKEVETTSKGLAKETVKKGIMAYIKKHPVVLIIIGIIILLFLILIIILGYSAEEDSSKTEGYYDNLCNFNDSTIDLESCNSEELISNYELKDYVIDMAYNYTKSASYSENTIKALMIVLKTNALSYGSYSSTNKNLSVNLCDVYSGGEYTPHSGDNSDLSTLYSEISDYLFVSSSYKSTISNLGSGNVLELNANTLNAFESLSAQGLTYKEILDNYYHVDENTSTPIASNLSTIYIGDSRTQGMLANSITSENNTVYGTGCGYNWFIGGTCKRTNASNGAINGANSLMNPSTSYNIVIWLGVNDLGGGANRYYEKYVELATSSWQNHNLYIVEVGPVKEPTSVTNESINNFNNTMQSLIASSGLSNLFYLDLDYNITNYDNAGLHYGKSDYQNIYNNINEKLNNATISAKKELYKLSDYCTFFNLTANTAYWWPIGSKEATNGNIYGGSPVSIAISSYFGPRIDPIDGTYHAGGHGAIDIPAATGTPVIATRSGTVTFANNDCPAPGASCKWYGNKVEIDHGDGYTTLYAHMTKTVAQVGSHVEQGQVIGYVGSTGRSTGPHLHFEVHSNGTNVDPLDYVNPENPRPVNVYASIEIPDGTDASQNKQLTCQALLQSGYSKNAVIGIMINMEHEGGFRTTNLEGCYETGKCCTKKSGAKYGYCVHSEINGFGSDSAYTAGVDSGAYSRESFANDHAGYGLIQWTSSGRKAGLYDYAKSQNKSIGSLSTQLGYLLEEVKGYSVTYKYVTGNYSAYDIATNFCLDFERPDNKTVGCPARASQHLEEFTNFVNNGCSY